MIRCALLPSIRWSTQSKDVSADVAAEIQTRYDIDGEPVPEHVKDFVESHARSSTPQLALRLV
jgi:hypothetical protein